MIFEEFLNALKDRDLWDDFSVTHAKTDWDRITEQDWSRRLKAIGEPGPMLFSNCYQLEGCEGGDYRGRRSEYRPSGPKPHFIRLDSLLLTLNPTLALSKYIGLKARVKLLTWQEPAYYGNEYNYAVEYVSLRYVYEALYG